MDVNIASTVLMELRDAAQRTARHRPLAVARPPRPEQAPAPAKCRQNHAKSGKDQEGIWQMDFGESGKNQAKSGKNRANGFLPSRIEDAKADSQGRIPEFLKDSLRIHEGNAIIMKPEWSRKNLAKSGKDLANIRQNQAKF